jgi:rRNA maturation protein Rpf1
LNVDTKRTAVEQYVEEAHARGSTDVAWLVVPNRRGRVNKLVFREDKAETPGWYCYLVEPLSAPGKV